MKKVYLFRVVPTVNSGWYSSYNGKFMKFSHTDIEPFFVGTKQEARKYAMVHHLLLVPAGKAPFVYRFQYNWRGKSMFSEFQGDDILIN